MRGSFAFLVIIAAVFVTVQAFSLYKECGIEQHDVGEGEGKYYDVADCNNLIRSLTIKNPMNCLWNCNRIWQQCKAFNVRPLKRDSAVLTCELLKNKPTKATNMPVCFGRMNEIGNFFKCQPKSRPVADIYSYTGGNTCKMEIYGCIRRSRYRSDGKGMIFMGVEKIYEMGNRTILHCQDKCTKFIDDNIQCNHFTFALLTSRTYSTCRFYHLKSGSAINRYLVLETARDRYNRYSGDAPCPGYNSGSFKTVITL